MNEGVEYRVNMTSDVFLVGLLDDETPAALDLAQKTSRLVTKSSTGRWSPKAAEREIREQILDLQNTILSRREGEVSNIYKLAELTQILQVPHFDELKGRLA